MKKKIENYYLIKSIEAPVTDPPKDAPMRPGRIWVYLLPPVVVVVVVGGPGPGWPGHPQGP